MRKNRFAVVLIFALTLNANICIAQQSSGECSPIINGTNGNVNINCNAGGADKILNEREKFDAQKRLEDEKILYRQKNGGCGLGFHSVCHQKLTPDAWGDRPLGSIWCDCDPN